MADDMLSKLPDVLIQEILSFLSLGEAVRTSILSKRWEFLWTSSPNLDFVVYGEEDGKFVDRALSLRQSRVHECSISFGDHRDSQGCVIHLRRWIMALVSLHVEDLHLAFFRHDFAYPFEFPQCLFTCASLTSFSLFMNWEISCLASINLSNLKNLVLGYVFFDDAESIDKLFTGCPMLETASLIQCVFLCDFRISAPKLYKLVIEEADWYDEYDALTCNDIMIFGPSLKSFSLHCDCLNSYSLYDQSCLDNAKISIVYIQSFFDGSSEWERFICPFYKLLKCLPLVKKLSLSSQALGALSYQGNLLVEVPFFNNLSVLSIVYGKPIGFYLHDYIGLMKILQKCPCLETLRFEKGVILLSVDHEEYERTLDPVPPCFFSSLKTLEILFKKSDDYPKLFMNAAKLLLERASVVEKFILYASDSKGVYGTDKEKVIKGLNELPRASKVCQFEFCDFEMKSI